MQRVVELCDDPTSKEFWVLRVFARSAAGASAVLLRWADGAALFSVAVLRDELFHGVKELRRGQMGVSKGRRIVDVAEDFLDGQQVARLGGEVVRCERVPDVVPAWSSQSAKDWMSFYKLSNIEMWLLLFAENVVLPQSSHLLTSFSPATLAIMSNSDGHKYRIFTGYIWIPLPERIR